MLYWYLTQQTHVSLNGPHDSNFSMARRLARQSPPPLPPFVLSLTQLYHAIKPSVVEFVTWTTLNTVKLSGIDIVAWSMMHEISESF